jgi:hypothetical protein
MRHLTILALVAAASAVPAEEGNWTPLDGDQIRAALTDRVLEYETAWQDFRSSGRTLYHAGSDSWGYWRVQGDQYCSQWPPSDLWTCYDMDRQGNALRFVGETGDITRGVYRD